MVRQRQIPVPDEGQHDRSRLRGWSIVWERQRKNRVYYGNVYPDEQQIKVGFTVSVHKRI
jgi:hypothetical protein